MLSDKVFDGIAQWLKEGLLGGIFESLDPAIIVFLLLGVAGGILLILSFFLDGLFDALDFGNDGPLSLITISAFVSIFGFSALAASSMGLGAGGASVTGSLVGLAGATGSFWLTRSMKKIESDGHEASSFEGSSAIVITPIPEEGLGEVALTRSGQRMVITARSSVAIPAGKKVTIQNVLSSNSVFVIVNNENSDNQMTHENSTEINGNFE